MTSPIQAPSLLVDPGTVDPFDRGNGVTTTAYVGRWNSEHTTITTGATEFQVGTGLPLHSHNVEETVLILEGLATAQIGDEYVGLEPGNATWVPAGVPHRFLNRGNTIMRIYWVYGGRHVTRTITATGETFEHLSEHDRSGIAVIPSATGRNADSAQGHRPQARSQTSSPVATGWS